MTQFLPTWIFFVLVPALRREKSSLVCMSVVEYAGSQLVAHGSKVKGGFQIFGTKHRGATCQKLISVFSQSSIFPTFAFSFSSFLA
jgi:hypothetical protein